MWKKIEKSDTIVTIHRLRNEKEETINENFNGN